ncbi:MAG: hypothetical protein WDW36_002947 [Sanguina aurantia]
MQDGTKIMGVTHPTAADKVRAYRATQMFTYAKTSAQTDDGPWPDDFMIQHQPSSTWLPLWVLGAHYDRVEQGLQPPPWPVERRGGTQLSTAATPQPDDIEDMDWESGDSGMDESDLQELSCAVDMETELPARLGFPLLPRVPVRSTTDGSTPQPGGRGVLHPSAAAQRRLPRLLLVVDTNVLVCSAARRVVAAVGTLLRPTAKAASLAGLAPLARPRRRVPGTGLADTHRHDSPCRDVHRWPCTQPPGVALLAGPVLWPGTGDHAAPALRCARDTPVHLSQRVHSLSSRALLQGPTDDRHVEGAKRVHHVEPGWCAVVRHAQCPGRMGRRARIVGRECTAHLDTDVPASVGPTPLCGKLTSFLLLLRLSMPKGGAALSWCACQHTPQDSLRMLANTPPGASHEATSEQAGLDTGSQDMDMEAEWLQAAEDAQCSSFDVIACVPLVVLMELDLIKGRVQRAGGVSGADSKRAQGARAGISLLLDDSKAQDPFFHVQEFTDKRAAEKVDIGLEGDREPSPDDRILQCCMHYQRVLEQAPPEASGPTHPSRVVLLSQDKALILRAHHARVTALPPGELLSAPASPGTPLSDEDIEQRLLNLLLTGELDAPRSSADLSRQASSNASRPSSIDGGHRCAVPEQQQPAAAAAAAAAAAPLPQQQQPASSQDPSHGDAHDGEMMMRMAVDPDPSLLEAMQHMQLHTAAVRQPALQPSQQQIQMHEQHMQHHHLMQQLQEQQQQNGGGAAPATASQCSPSPAKKLGAAAKKTLAKAAAATAAAAAAAAGGDSPDPLTSPASSTSPQPGDGSEAAAGGSKPPGKAPKNPTVATKKATAAAAAAAAAAQPGLGPRQGQSPLAGRGPFVPADQQQPPAAARAPAGSGGGPAGPPPSGLYEEMQVELNLITQALGPLVESAFEAEHQALWPNTVCRPQPWKSFDILTIVVKHCQVICKPLEKQAKGHHQVVRDLAMRMEQAAK